MSRKEHIVIAMPALDGRNPVAFTGWLAQLASTNSDRYSPYAFSFISPSYKQPYEYPRNIAVTDFLKTDGDRLWFIDSDMIPRPASIGLLGIEGDIVVGAYMRASPKEEDETIRLDLLIFEENPEPNQDSRLRSIKMDGRKDAFEIMAGGTGCMLITRQVLEDERMRLPTKYVNARGREVDHMEEREKPGWALPIFRTLRRPDGNTDRGEDIDFCLRARELGYSIRGHMLYGMDHQKTTTTDMLARSFLRERAAARAAAKETPA